MSYRLATRTPIRSKNQGILLAVRYCSYLNICSMPT
ncbi:Uncharacterised protein [Vibrio cholerae]|nr:Uncharacterised protein [Vibrio cholerae]